MNDTDRTVQVPVSLIERIERELEYRVRTVASRIRMAEKHDEPYPREWVDNEVVAGRERVRALLSQPTPTAEPCKRCAGTGYITSPPMPDVVDLPCPNCSDAEPPRIEDMAPGTTFTGTTRQWPTQRFERVSRGRVKAENGTLWSPLDYQGRERIDPSMIRDVTPPRVTP